MSQKNATEMRMLKHENNRTLGMYMEGIKWMLIQAEGKYN